MSEEDILSNQTQFAAEEPFLQNPPIKAEEQVTSKSKLNKKYLFLLIPIFLLIMGTLVGWLLLSNQQIESENVTTPVLEEKITTKLSPLRQEVQALQQQFKAADPMVDEWAFPLVDLEAPTF